MVGPLTLGGGFGCSLPPPRPDFSSVNPQDRTLAVAEAARRSDRSSIPRLIEMLDSPDSAQRMLAITTLERLTGQTLGYAYWAPEHQRNEAVSRWMDWWESEHGAVPIDGGERGDESR